VSDRGLNLLGIVLIGIIGLAFMFLTPRVAELDTVLDLTVYMIMAILALSLALIWGYGGILCFGQSAFFGLGAYTYAIAMFNIGESTLPFLLAIILPAAFAALLGYFMFYGRISDVYLGVITLTVTLILFNSVNSTAGPEFHIGAARLGGFNGIPGIPPLNWPFDKNAPIDLEGMFYLSTASLLLTYFGLRLLLASQFGRVMVGIRENERRAELLGYDPRAYKLATFTIGGALAGFAGCLFANWGNFVSPTIFGLAQSAQIIIWVIVGGRGTLIGPVIGCIGIQWLTAALGANQPSGGSDWWSKIFANAPLILGIILIAFVLLVPKGLVPTLADIAVSLRLRRQRERRGLSPQQAEESDGRTAASNPQSLRALWWRQGRQRCQLHASRRRAALSDRPQRGGQEHVLQDADRPARAEPRRGAVSGA
jgi:branched-chain amino acid transport system permease protein